MFERCIENREQGGVLPETEREGHNEHSNTDEQPTAQLIEVVQQAQLVGVADSGQNFRHASAHLTVPEGDASVAACVTAVTRSCRLRIR